MATLISTTGMATVCDQLALAYSSLQSGIYPANFLLQTLANTTLYTSVFPDAADRSEANNYFNDISRMYSSINNSNTLSSNNGGFAGASSNGKFNFVNLVQSAFSGELNSLDWEINQFVLTNNYTTLVQYLTGTGLQVSGTFADMYYITRTAYIPTASIFAPTGVVLGTITVGTVVLGAFPTTNGYTSPAPTVNSYGYNTYIGNLANPIGFAPCQVIKAVTSAAIVGTCEVTVTAPNQSGVSSTWTGTLDNLNINSTIILTPTINGNYLGGTPTAITFAGTATTPSFTIQTVSLR